MFDLACFAICANQSNLQVMSDLLSRIRDQASVKQSKTEAAKAKTELEKKASAEMRQAAAEGRVLRHRLTDITKAEGVTAREKGGQRTNRYAD